MSLKFYYTINPSLLIQPTVAKQLSSQNRSLNILIKDQNALNGDLLTAITSLENDYIISVSADLLTTNIIQDILPKLFILISTNSFPKENGIIIPVFVHPSIEYSQIYSTEIVKYFNLQGIGNIRLVQFKDDYDDFDKFQIAEDCLLIPGSLKEKNAINLFDKKDILNIDSLSYIIIGLDVEINNIITFNQSISRFNDDIEFNIRYHDLEEFCSRYMTLKAFDGEKKLWEKRAKLYQSFLQLSKDVQQKEYYEILDWYKNEYEVLPLWYKRFGHIIKVIMGKRNLQSLFNDNVKKYKD